MSGYLEAYGASEEQRARRFGILKNTAIAVAVLLIASGTLYGIFKNYSEEQQAKTFVARLGAHDYPGAYGLWGCSESKPCPDYPYDKFLDDWGPKSAHAAQGAPDMDSSQGCGSGVLIRLNYKDAGQPVTLWVENATKVISFAPWEECPGRHLHFKAWFQSLFQH
jgi:hypothetical protein